MGTGDILLGVWTSFPSMQGEVALLLVAHATETGDKLCGLCATFPLPYSYDLYKLCFSTLGMGEGVGFTSRSKCLVPCIKAVVFQLFKI